MKIFVKDIKIGMCVAESVYNSSNKIILKKNVFIESQKQINLLFDNEINSIEIDENKSLVELPQKSTKIKKLSPLDKDLKTKIRKAKNYKENKIKAQNTYNEIGKVINQTVKELESGLFFDSNSITHAVNRLGLDLSENYSALFSLLHSKVKNYSIIQHSIDVCLISLGIADQIVKSNNLLNQIGAGAILHDIGKAKISSHIRNKNGLLNSQEKKIIQKHVYYGNRICIDNKISSKIISDIIMSHHEFYDGSGYPEGLKAGRLNKYASIVSIANYYDNLINGFSIYNQMTPSKAVRIIFSLSGKKFDPRLVNFFIKTVGIYPIGTTVKLKSKRVGLVVAFSKHNLKFPVIRILADEKENYLKKPITISLFDEEDSIETTNVELKRGIKL